MPDRHDIIREIQRVAAAVGRPPGREIFEKETGIRRSVWFGIYWRSWSDALAEAGLSANLLQEKLSPDDVLRQFGDAVRHFGRVPADIDLRMFGRDRKDFPSHSTFTNHFGGKEGLVAAFSRWILDKPDYRELSSLFPTPSVSPTRPTEAVKDGYVYLLRSGSHFKIGHSDNLERRVKEITVTLPEATTVEHVIQTDDPPGIEAYWHRRFAALRANGEWFNLSKADVRAFKRRKFQ